MSNVKNIAKGIKETDVNWREGISLGPCTQVSLEQLVACQAEGMPESN